MYCASAQRIAVRAPPSRIGGKRCIGQKKKSPKVPLSLFLPRVRVTHLRTRYDTVETQQHMFRENIRVYSLSTHKYVDGSVRCLLRWSDACLMPDWIHIEHGPFLSQFCIFCDFGGRFHREVSSECVKRGIRRAGLDVMRPHHSLLWFRFYSVVCCQKKYVLVLNILRRSFTETRADDLLIICCLKRSAVAGLRLAYSLLRALIFAIGVYVVLGGWLVASDFRICTAVLYFVCIYNKECFLYFFGGLVFR